MKAAEPQVEAGCVERRGLSGGKVTSSDGGGMSKCWVSEPNQV